MKMKKSKEIIREVEEDMKESVHKRRPSGYRVRRGLAILLAAVMTLALIPMTPLTALAATEVASGTCGTNVTWALDDAGVLTISGTGAMTSFSDTSSVPWYSSYRSTIKKVVIESGVTSIGQYAFQDCTALTTATIATSVTLIGARAFFSCTNLALTELPNSVTRIDGNAFTYCSNLALTKLPSGLTDIGINTFGSCTKLNLTELPSGLAGIGSGAFSGCTRLTRLELPASLTSMMTAVFGSCSNLKTLVFKGDQAPTVLNSLIGSNLAANGTLYYPQGASGYDAIEVPYNWTKTAYTPLAFDTQPAAKTVLEGETAEFGVSSISLPTLSYQWQESADGTTWNNITNGGIYSGATTADLTLTGVTAAMNGNQYRCAATNGVYTTGVTSDPATLTVIYPVCEIVETEKEYTGLADALAAVKEGETIKLLDDISYNDGIKITDMSLTLDVNGFRLNVAPASGTALEVGSGGEVILDDSAGGEFNVVNTSATSGHYGLYAHDGGKATVTNVTAVRDGVNASGTGTEVTVTGSVEIITGTSWLSGVWAGSGALVNVAGSVTVTGINCKGVTANDSGTVVNVGGNVKMTNGDVYSSGAAVTGGGKVTVDGTITTERSDRYVSIGSSNKSKSDGISSAAKPGYFEYTDGTSTVWVLDPSIGNGTANYPYIITTAGQLAGYTSFINEGTGTYASSYYKLEADIDLSGYGESNTDFNDGKGWVPIGTGSNRFTGVFDGEDYKITGLYINDSSLNNAGLFGSVSGTGCEIKNLGVEGVNIRGYNQVGGVTGSIMNSAIVVDCYVTGTVRGHSIVGGVAGYSSNHITRCYANADVSAIEGGIAGGVAGRLRYGNISGCHSTGTVTGEGIKVGGVVGEALENGKVINCHATGNVTGTGNVGGVVGYIDGDSGQITNCYATGDVSGTGSHIGGVAGDVLNNSKVTNCYATGCITGGAASTSVGGVAGYINAGGSVSYSYAVGAVSGLSYVGGVVGSIGSGDGSSIINCVALNPGIEETGSYVGRVLGNKGGTNSTFFGNRAYAGLLDKDGLTTSWTNKLADQKNGADMSAANALTAAFWKTADNWDGSAWDADVWTFADGKLPILKNVSGTQTGEPGAYLTDPPTGKIELGTHAWNSFWNTISFEIFSKNPQTVTISGEDYFGDAVTIEYYLSATELTQAEAIAVADWLDYDGTLTVQSGKYIVYAKLTDDYGKMSIINSAGVVVYTDSEQYTAAIGFSKASGENKTADVTLNGNTVAKIMNSNGDTLTPTTDYTVSGGTITFNATYLDGLDAGNYTFTVSYNPQGMEYKTGVGNDEPAATTIALKVGKPVTDPVCEIVDNGVTVMQYDDLADALDDVQDGQTIRLLQNIEYNDGILITGKSITFDVKGFILNVAPTSGMALEVGSGGEVILDDSAGGEFNIVNNDASKFSVYAHDGGKVTVTGVTGKGDGVNASGTGTDVTVTGSVEITAGTSWVSGVWAGSGAVVNVAGSVTATGTNCKGVSANNSGTVVNVGGNIKMTNGGANSSGAAVAGGGKVTVDGTITIQSSGRYVTIESSNKSKSDGISSVTKPGYIEYTNNTSYVWVKAAAAAPPTGKIELGTHSWNSFWNTITFDIFSRNKKITITGEDYRGGAVNIEYYISAMELTQAEAEAIADADWLDYNGTLTVQPGKHIVYARLTDDDGRVSIINSSGIVVYTDSEQDTDAISYTKGSGDNKTADVTLNGNTVAKIMNGSATLEKDTDYTVNGGTITFYATYLEGLDAGNYTLTVSYNPQGMEYKTGAGNDKPAATTIALKVRESVTGPVCEIVDNGVTVMQYDYLADALDDVQDGQTIRLLEDIEYNDGILIDGIIVTFDLNGFILNEANPNLTVTNWGDALEVRDGGELKLTGDGEFNVTAPYEYGVYAYGGGKAEVTNVTADYVGVGIRGEDSRVTVTGNVTVTSENDGLYGVTAYNGATVTVGGNVTVTGENNCYGVEVTEGATVTVGGNVTVTGQDCYGVWVYGGVEVTIEGMIIVPDTGTYIECGSETKTKADYEADSGKQGYLEYTDGESYVWVKNAVPLPTGEITLSTHMWNSFWNTILFDIFSKDTQTVTITGEDCLGDAVTIQYFLSTGELTGTQAEAIDDADWLDYTGTITLRPGRHIVYAKLTDDYGNVCIINSSGVVVYTDSAAVTTSISHIKLSGAKQAEVVLNGNTIAKINDGNRDLNPGSDYTVSDGTITFGEAYLDGLAAGSHTLTVYYNPQGEAYVANGDPDTNDIPAATEISLTVINTAPTITTTTLPEGQVGAAYSQPLTATGTTPIIWTLESGSLPDGLGLSEAGVISGTPTTDGTFTFTVKASNDTAPDAEKQLSITINPIPVTGTAPTITTTALSDGQVGEAYSQPLTAIGTTPITWTLESGSLPDGLGLSETGVISGTPTADGTFTFTVKASNGTAPDAEKQLSITINPTPVTDTAPTITTTALPDGRVGEAYSQPLTATGTKPITWTLESGSLPDGLALSEAGVISGTPTADGTFTFTVKAANGIAPDATRQLEITVTDGGTTFVPVTGITGVPTAATAGTPLILTGTVTPADATNKTITWTVKSRGTTGAGITGNTLNTTAAGTVTVTATVTNGKAEGADYQQDFNITVKAAPVTKTAAAPTADKKGKTYTDKVKVKLKSTTPGAKIYYTTDGKTPGVKSKFVVSGGTVTIKKTATLKCITVAAGYKDSSVTSIKYTIKTAKPGVKAVPKSKKVKQGTKIKLKAPKGVTLYYTTNGKKPTAKTKTKVKPGKSKKIKITKTTTLKVIAKKSGCKVSGVLKRKYTVSSRP